MNLPSAADVATTATEPAVATAVAAAASTEGSGRWGSLGPLGLVLAGGISVQFGGALAVTLMPRVGALGVVALRLAVAAIVLLAVCRPKVRGYSRADWGTIVVFGITMAAMNGLFYQSVDRIPLGTAVTLEVLGPLALSVLASRRAVNLVWAGLALGGVFLLGGGGFSSLDPVGVAFALSAGAMWATYIVFSARTGRRFPRPTASRSPWWSRRWCSCRWGSWSRARSSWSPRRSPWAQPSPYSPPSSPTPSNSSPCAASPPPPSPSS